MNVKHGPFIDVEATFVKADLELGKVVLRTTIGSKPAPITMDKVEATRLRDELNRVLGTNSIFIGASVTNSTIVVGGIPKTTVTAEVGSPSAWPMVGTKETK